MVNTVYKINYDRYFLIEQSEYNGMIVAIIILYLINNVYKDKHTIA